MSDANTPDKHAEGEPKATIGDLAHTGAKAAIPIAGAVIGGAIGGPPGAAIGLLSGVVAEFFSTILASPLSKRQAEWLTSLHTDLATLAKTVEGLTPEELEQNPQFISMLYRASRMVLGTHQKEKLEALRNAVLNSALPNAPDADTQLMFLTLVDDLTVTHLKMLKHCANQQFKNDQQAVFDSIFPDYSVRTSFYDQVARDLYARAMIATDSFDYPLSPGAVGNAGYASDFAKQFLAFITSPIPEEEQEQGGS